MYLLPVPSSLTDQGTRYHIWARYGARVETDDFRTLENLRKRLSTDYWDGRDAVIVETTTTARVIEILDPAFARELNHPAPTAEEIALKRAIDAQLAADKALKELEELMQITAPENIDIADWTVEHLRQYYGRVPDAGN